MLKASVITSLRKWATLRTFWWMRMLLVMFLYSTSLAMVFSLIMYVVKGSLFWEGLFWLTGWSVIVSLVLALCNAVVLRFLRRYRLHRLRKVSSMSKNIQKHDGFTNRPNS